MNSSYPTQRWTIPSDHHKVMQTALKFFLSSLLILVGIVCFLIFGLFFHFAEIESVELKTDPQFKDAHWTPELKQKILSHLSGYKGRKIWTVELDEIARNLRDLYPAVQPRIYRQLPNRIVVFLKKSAPLLLLFRDQGDIHPISAQGDLQPPLSSNQLMDLPVLRGDFFYKNTDLRKQACSLIRRFPDKGLLIPKNISEITYNEKKKTFSLFLIPGYMTLEITAHPSEKQILNINFVLKYLLQRKITDRTVNARSEKKIIVSTPHSS